LKRCAGSTLLDGAVFGVFPLSRQNESSTSKNTLPAIPQEAFQRAQIGDGAQFIRSGWSCHAPTLRDARAAAGRHRVPNSTMLIPFAVPGSATCARDDRPAAKWTLHHSGWCGIDCQALNDPLNFDITD
jgi:hypothetical protein